MSDYTKTTNFTAKDSLSSGDPNKLITGALFDTEFDAIVTSNNTKANKVIGGTVNKLLKQSASGDLVDATSITDDGADVIIATGRGLRVTDNGELWLAGTAVTATGLEINKLSGSAAGTVLTTGNEGSGNGLDADTLDGSEGSFYTNASNLNAGTVPDARLPTATTTQVGVLETATNAEALAGTATNKIIVPANLPQFNTVAIVDNQVSGGAAIMGLATVFSSNAPGDFYRVIGNVYPVTSAQILRIQLADATGSSYITTSSYHYAGNGGTTTSVAARWGSTNTATTQIDLCAAAAVQDVLRPLIFDITFYNPMSTSQYTLFTGTVTYTDASYQLVAASISGRLSSSAASAGFKVYAASGDIAGEISVIRYNGTI